MRRREQEMWFEEIYRETAPAVRRCARAFTRMHPALQDEMDDLVQETYIRMYKKYEELQNHEAVIKWLIVTLRNLFSNRVRVQQTKNRYVVWEIDRSKVFDNTFADVCAQVDAAIENEDMELLRKISNHIGEEKLELLQQYYLDKIPLKELADREGISPEAMKMRISRLRKKCSEILMIILLLEALLFRGYIHIRDEGYNSERTVEILLRAGSANDIAARNEQGQQQDGYESGEGVPVLSLSSE